jgi:hypothetical protein
MLILSIKIELEPDKNIEFNQCWHSFVQHVQKMDGSSYEMKYLGKNTCKLFLRFEQQKQLDIMMQNEWYTFLMGAIKTLGQNFETELV